MKDVYAEEMIKEVRNALELMTHSVQSHLPRLGEDFKAALDDLDRKTQDIQYRRTRDILMGRGPKAQLRAELGFSKPKLQTNIFELWPKECQLTPASLQHLMAEFFVASMVRGPEGGDYRPNVDDLDTIGQKPKDLSTGLYKVSDGWIAMVLTIHDGATVHHLVYPLKTTTRSPLPMEPTVVTFVDAERSWVTHTFFEVLNVTRVRSALIAWLDGQGVDIPTPISEEEVKAGVLKRIRLEEEVGVEVIHPDVGKRKIEITVDNYMATVIYNTLGEEEEPLVVLLVKTYHGHNQWQSDKSLSWQDLSPTKQQQLYRKLTQVDKPNLT